MPLMKQMVSIVRFYLQSQQQTRDIYSKYKYVISRKCVRKRHCLPRMDMFAEALLCKFNLY